MTVMIEEHDCVVLTQNIPEEGLEAGDIGTVIHIHDGGAGYEVEFMTLTGETVAVATLLPPFSSLASLLLAPEARERGRCGI